MTIGHAILTLAAINAILFEDGTKPRKLPFKVKLGLSRTKESLEKEVKVYEDERVRLVNELGEETELPDGSKGLEVKDPEKIETFYKALEEILKTEIDTNYYKISAKDLALIEDVEIDITDAQIRAFYDYAIAKDA